ncbi:MAG: oxidoreductase [Solirubrobacterales bacterium]|jgi:NAD(P)-dependent dehydrogenase (short-subunit alcohol dehydrogenase family)|nr:oxidoreductase [Solirubrobacterales bacterium]
MSSILETKIAIVTGAARGIGLAIAEAYAEQGATVVLADIDAVAGEAAAAGIERGEFVACDVTDEAQVEALVAGTVERHGGLDVMVGNAGIATVSPIVSMSYEDWRRVLAVDLDGVFLCTKHAAGAMAASGGGSIVNIASIKAFGGAPATGSYGAAKAGVVSLTKTVAMEMRDHGVRANAICPGWVETDMVNDRKAELEAVLGLSFDDYIGHVQGGRLGTPAEIATLAVFLASDRSRFSSGSTYNVDMGATASLV